LISPCRHWIPATLFALTPRRDRFSNGGLVHLTLGRHAMIPPFLMQPLTLKSYASGTWGCGNYWSRVWFQLLWNNALQDTDIFTKELCSSNCAINSYTGQDLARSVLSDNTAAAVAADNNCTLAHQESAHLLCCLAFLTTHYQCILKTHHILDNIMSLLMPCVGKM